MDDIDSIIHNSEHGQQITKVLAEFAVSFGRELVRKARIIGDGECTHNTIK